MKPRSPDLSGDDMTKIGVWATERPQTSAHNPVTLGFGDLF